MKDKESKINYQIPIMKKLINQEKVNEKNLLSQKNDKNLKGSNDDLKIQNININSPKQKLNFVKPNNKIKSKDETVTLENNDINEDNNDLNNNNNELSASKYVTTFLSSFRMMKSATKDDLEYQTTDRSDHDDFIQNKGGLGRDESFSCLNLFKWRSVDAK